jgi:ergothioneine biosynthesis protein EgtB
MGLKIMSSSSFLGIANPPSVHGELSRSERYNGVRQTSLRCCAPLNVEDHGLQAMPDASPAKWHLAHTTWFFETFVLSENLPGYKPINPAFRSLFNSYYNAVGDRPLRALRHVLSRPSLGEVREYRQHVDQAMLHLLERELASDVLDLVALGLNHEQQHQELILTDVKYGLAANPLRPAYRESSRRDSKSQSSAPALRWQSYSKGVYPVGFQREGFAFDNEGPRHNVYLAPFRLAKRLVTNGEYLEFMRDNGYKTATLWLSDGWDTVQANAWSAPLYWEIRDGQWWHYTMDGMQAVRPEEPVCHVTYYEADAFSRWADARLATEYEWEVASQSCCINGNFMESGSLHPGVAEESSGLTQVFGDVWEWTASAYLPYPGYQPAAGALGEYNGKFMCNQMVLRGGSCATPQSHIRRTYRNFFPPHARWQFMGIRLANGD